MVGLIFLGGCNKPSTLGSEFVGDDVLVIERTSDFDITTKTVVRDPLTIYIDHFVIPNTSLIGEVNESIFGKTRSEVFTQMDFAARKGNPFDSAMIDSIRLVFLYDTFGVYGTVEEEVTLRIFELEEWIDEDATYKSNKRFSTFPMPIAEHRFLPTPYDSADIKSGDTTIKALPQLSIPIDLSFGDKLQALDSAYWSVPDSFREVINGFHLELEAENTMLGFRLDRFDVSRLKVYYTKMDDTTQSVFNFALDDVVPKTSYYEHDYSGSLVGDILNDSLSGLSDSLIFLQEMQGLSPKLTITGLNKLEGTLINEAVLEFSVAELSNDNSDLYPKISLLSAEYYGDTSIVDIVDVSNAKNLAARQGSTSFYVSTFGGNCESTSDTVGVKNIYRAAITSHLQDLISSGEDEAVILISSFLRPESPRRVVFYGNDSEHPVKLSVTYTELQ
jgi:hypothetical protein